MEVLSPEEGKKVLGCVLLVGGMILRSRENQSQQENEFGNKNSGDRTRRLGSEQRRREKTVRLISVP